MSETTQSDRQLLDRYTRHQAEDAFAEIVRRHLALVHSAALRQVRSPQLAEEVAQSAFLKLARHARQLTPDTILSAWLYQVTRREAIDVVRREAGRQLREQIATEMNAMNATAAVAGTTIAAAATAITMTTLQKTLIAAALATAVGVGIYEANQAATERAKWQTLTQQHATLSNQLEQTARDLDAAARQLAALRNTLAESNRPPAELLRLRSEAGLLRQQLGDASRRQAALPVEANNLLANWPTRELRLLAQMQNVGLGSPEVAAQTYWAALRDRDTAQLKLCMVFEDLPAQPAISDYYARREVHSESQLHATNVERGFFLTAVALEPSGAELTYHVGAQSWPRRTASTDPRGEPRWLPVREEKLRLAKVGAEWKVAVSSQRLRIVLDDFDPEATADGLMQMTPEQCWNHKTIPPKTRQALEEMKARAGK